MMNKKGITPIIAVILLLMMTVAAAGAAYFWLTTIQTRIQAQIGTKITESTSTSFANVKLINALCNTGNQRVTVTVQNTATTATSSGTSVLTLTNNQNAVIASETTEVTSIASQAVSSIIYNLDASTIATASVYGVKITLPAGVEQTVDCTAD